MKVPKAEKQSGFILMLMIVILVVGAGAYFAQFSSNKFFQHQSAEAEKTLSNLEKVKQNILLYGSLHPEIYATDASTSYTYYQSFRIPGPGYLPCPDNDGRVGGDAPDGQMLSSCQDTTVADDGLVHGFLTPFIESRNFFFTPTRQPKTYYYVALEKLVYQNPKYLNTAPDGTNLNRFAPLNDTFNPPTLLSLNGKADYVALIIAPGVAKVYPDGFTQDQTLNSPENFLDFKTGVDGGGNTVRENGNVLLDNSLNTEFFSQSVFNPGINDLVVGITLEEWREMVLTRAQNQRTLLCSNLLAASPHWFNEYSAINNTVGNNWRGRLCN